MQQWVSAQTLAERFEMSRATFYEWARSQRLPSRKLGAALRFPLAEVETLLADRPQLIPLTAPRPRSYRHASMPKAGKERGVYERDPGSGVWWVRFADAQGRIVRERIGTSKVLALADYRKRKTEVAEGRFFPEKKADRPTVKEAINRHLAVQKTRIRGYRNQSRYGANWIEALGPKLLSAVTPADIEAYIETRCEGISETTMNHELKFLRRVFVVGIEHGWCTENPAKAVKLYRENNHRIRFLSDDEEAALKGKMTPADFVCVDFAINTGLRRAEQFELEWLNVDLVRRQLTIPRTKNGEVRYVPINDAVRAMLMAMPSRLVSRFVFPSAGKGDKPKDSYNFYRRVYLPALLAAEIDDFRWHDLRHTFASRLVMAGVDLPTVQQLMGHKSIAMTLRYAHLSPEHQLSAVQQLDKRPKKTTDTLTDTGVGGRRGKTPA